MVGATLKIEDQGFDQAIAAIDGVEQLDNGEVLDALGRLFQQSTRNRIEVTKTSPDGETWQKNNAGTSTLFQSGNLAASIDYQVGSAEVAIGSGLIYARIHQEGGEIKPKNADKLAFMVGNQLVFATKVTIPARPYLGASEDDKREALQMLADTISELFQ